MRTTLLELFSLFLRLDTFSWSVEFFFLEMIVVSPRPISSVGGIMLAPSLGFRITAASASLAISSFPAEDKLNLSSFRVARARRELSIS